MDLFVRTSHRLLIDRNGFDDMSAACVVCPRSPNLVVGTIQTDSVVRIARPSQVLIRSDDRKNLRVGIWDRVEDGVRAGRVAVNAAIGESVCLGEDGKRRGVQRCRAED